MNFYMLNALSIFSTLKYQLMLKELSKIKKRYCQSPMTSLRNLNELFWFGFLLTT